MEGADSVLVHWGVNDWTMPKVLPPGSSEHEDGKAARTPMERESDGTWWVVVPTDPEAWSLDFVFTDGQKWDNQAGEGHIPLR